MSAVNIRAATPADLPELTRLWHEKTVIRQQFDRRFTLMPGGDAEWSSAAGTWLADPAAAIIVAERDGELLGYVIGWVRPSPPGLMPQQMGLIIEMTIDAHGQQGGLGQRLLAHLRNWFAEQGIDCVIAVVPNRGAVEQAFWRTQGAVEWVDLLWLK